MASNAIAELKQRLLAEAQSVAGRVSKPADNFIKCRTNQGFETPDGQYFEGSEGFECVIIDFATTHEYYDQEFSPSGKKPPACVALGYDIATLAPIPQSPDPQCTSCAMCPMNQWGSKGSGKACKNSRLLALLPPVFDDEDPLMYVLKVTRGSLKFFDGYVQKLATRYKTVPIGVVTRVTLNPNVTWSEQHFEVVRPLEDHEFETYMKRRDEAKSVLMTPPDLSGWTPPDGRRVVPIQQAPALPAAKSAARSWGTKK